MGMMLKPRCSRWGKEAKKITDESVKDEGDIGCVF
jgi:hypothetical protein